MHLYHSLARSPEELTTALSEEGAVFALDLSRFEVVVNQNGVVLQMKGLEFLLPFAIPHGAFAVLLPHKEQFPAPPASAVAFAMNNHIGVGGTSS